MNFKLTLAGALALIIPTTAAVPAFAQIEQPRTSQAHNGATPSFASRRRRAGRSTVAAGPPAARAPRSPRHVARRDRA